MLGPQAVRNRRGEVKTISAVRAARQADQPLASVHRHVRKFLAETPSKQLLSPQESLAGTLSLLKPSGWPAQTCGSGQPGCWSELGVTGNLLCEDLDPPLTPCSPIRLNRVV